MEDITAIFITNNNLPEEWVKFHRKVLLQALGKIPLITISRKPMDLGTNIIQTEPSSPSNVYWQLLRGAKLATTEYIAVVEDDTLYPSEHFTFRPSKDKIGYNMNHMSLFTWDPEMYSWRNRRGNYSMLSNRELVIECLEERFAKWPKGTPDNRTGELGRHMVERNLGITLRDVEEFYSKVSIINFNHDMGMDDLQQRHRKSHGPIRAYDIPYWGKATELAKYFK